VIYILLEMEQHDDYQDVLEVMIGPPALSLQALENEFDTLWKAATKGLRGQPKKVEAIQRLYGWRQLTGLSLKTRYFAGFLETKGLKLVNWSEHTIISKW
jgi:hypothetical protein